MACKLDGCKDGTSGLETMEEKFTADVEKIRVRRQRRKGHGTWNVRSCAIGRDSGGQNFGFPRCHVDIPVGYFDGCTHKIAGSQQTSPQVGLIIKGHIYDAESDIERYNVEIQFFIRTLKSLRAHREAREHDRRSLKALISAHRQIPLEIWTQILGLKALPDGEIFRPLSYPEVDLDIPENAILSFLGARQQYGQATPVHVTIQFPYPSAHISSHHSHVYSPNTSDQRLADARANARLPALHLHFRMILESLATTMTELVLTNFSQN
ncbi:hypothetical protein C8J56DRAFT_889318 [Mycena floridula]|nr:hypothetical protein C8J56DRAFT_889318 [Mycena floridula]